MKIDYDGTISANENLRDDKTTYRMCLPAAPCAYVPAIAEAALERLLRTALKGMRFGGGCGLTYNVYLEDGVLHCSLTVSDLETDSSLWVIEDEDEKDEDEDFCEDYDDEDSEHPFRCRGACSPESSSVGFWSRFKRLLGFG